MIKPADFDDATKDDIRRLLILQIHSGLAKVDVSIVPVVLSRLYHDRLTGLNTAVYDQRLSFAERLAAYTQRGNDAAYGQAIAHRFGLTLGPEAATRYDVLKYPGDIRIDLFGEERFEFIRYLRNLNARSEQKEISVATEGINHLNIYSASRLELGKMLSNFWEDRQPYHTLHGSMTTLEGYYHILRLLDYLYSIHDLAYSTSADQYLLDKLFSLEQGSYRLTFLSGAEAIAYGRRLKQQVYGKTAYRPGAFSPWCERAFVHAMVGKFGQLKSSVNGICVGNLLAELVQHHIPLEHYYVKQGGIVHPPHSEWLPNICQWIGENIDPCGNGFDVAALQQKVLDEYEPIK